MALYLFISAVVIVVCVFFNRLSGKLGIPSLLAFILLGMFFGSDGLVKIPFDNYSFAEQICSVALIFIMFYGGFGTNWRAAKRIAAPAILLSSLGVVMTAGVVGLFCHLILKIEIAESFLIGAVIGSTDAASVFSILRSKRLNLKYNTASMLEVESGSNDPFSYMMTVIALSVMSGSVSGGGIAYMLFSQIVYGVAIGLIIAFAASWILKRFTFTAAGFDAVFVLAVAVFAYSVPTLLGGNGYLSAYIVGIILGNTDIKNKRSLVHFFDGITGLMQMILFFLLGLLSFPSQMPQVVLPALAIALFLTFVARPIAVFAILTPFKCKLKQQLLVSWSGLRGAASIVFAVMATVSPAHTGNDIFHIVFIIVLFSILIQGSLIPLASRKLDMIDNSVDVMNTFNDYSDEEPISFIQFLIKEEHPWALQRVNEILFPPDTILVLILRDKRKIVPKGDTIIIPDDILVLSAKSTEKIDGLRLIERHIVDGDKWEGKAVSQLPLEHKALIIMIRRGDEIIIPNGETVVQTNDVLVINHTV